MNNTPPPDARPEPEIRELPGEQIDVVEPLWLSLDAEHRRLGPAWAPWWDPATTWEIRRERYRHWLAEPDAFALAAYDDGAEPVGYLLAHFLAGPDDTWVTGPRICSIESLSVAPSWRGQGVGGRLLAAARARMASVGVQDLWVGVVHGNEDALRFYRRHGLRPLMVTVGSMPGPPSWNK
ncbi:GNAT family N-acetyltransferase [Nocardioides antri]|uniref:GNAT family N-acetyltransferase n=1 Tax=Nocardioides antri TaxID=2607659 RepID=A0A5B1LYQ2_9ACTN|nr:GNAT family N-acetyltransferase [Nocardioides antri]KAA1425793.1 GNAT family N-acetyltransferase [Nocardioides antri]